MRQSLFKKTELFRQCFRFGDEGLIVLRGVETRNVIQCCRSKLDPRSMLGATQRVGRMQRRHLSFFKVLKDNSTFENRGFANLENGCFT